MIINHTDKISKVQQIVNAIKADIEKGVLKRGDKLMSITEFAKSHEIARDTVEKAYGILKENGCLESVPGKGNYVLESSSQTLKILLIFNKLSSYKKEVYYGFVDALGPTAKVDLQIHHYDFSVLREIIINNRGAYHYFVIMPHFYHHTSRSEYEDIFKSIDPDSLILLDRNLDIDGVSLPSVFQDFKRDIYEALCQAKQLFSKYESITVLFPELSHHPIEILEGIGQFAIESGKELFRASDLKNIRLTKGQVYITLTESQLADLIKEIRRTKLVLGGDIGVLSFNETVFKELLDITVVTSEFAEMGAKVAKMIIEKNFRQERNKFRLIIRKSQ